VLDLSDPMGIARITDDDGHTVTFRRPRWRHLEELRVLQMEIISKTRAARDEIRAWIEDHKNDDGTISNDLVDQKVHEINVRQFELIAGWWSRAIELVGDGDWPTDWREWPAWMIEGAGCIDQLVRYWRTVPLDRGAMGRPEKTIPNPTETETAAASTI
jgi:hypothetical protein